MSCFTIIVWDAVLCIYLSFFHSFIQITVSLQYISTHMSYPPLTPPIAVSFCSPPFVIFLTYFVVVIIVGFYLKNKFYERVTRFYHFLFFCICFSNPTSIDNKVIVICVICVTSLLSLKFSPYSHVLFVFFVFYLT